MPHTLVHAYLSLWSASPGRRTPHTGDASERCTLLAHSRRSSRGVLWLAPAKKLVHKRASRMPRGAKALNKLFLELHSMCQQLGVVHRPLHELLLELAPHPRTVLPEPLRLDVPSLGHGLAKLVDNVPHLFDAFLAQRRATLHARPPCWSLSAHELQRMHKVGRRVTCGVGERAVALVDNHHVGDLHDPLLDALQLVAASRWRD
mmetsp:Transcript_16236/g.41187  ORF Transcript_16236/g.41187 Transcript_16236/m.41187 type:complete len:204 (+) Transcript_16236:246-857(+)